MLDAVYAMPKPDLAPSYHGFTIANGNYVIVTLTAVLEGKAEDASEQDRVGLSAYLARSYGDSELRAFLASLKADADIDISAEYLK